MCNFANYQGKLDYSPIDEYGKGASAIFEGRKVCIPQNYDQYFTRKYGEWQKELPAEKQVSHHKFLVCDPFNSYQKYLVVRHGKVRIKDEVSHG